MMGVSTAHRQHVLSIEQAVRQEHESKAQALAKQAAVASYAHIESQIKSDMELLKSKIGDSNTQAIETAKDLKYIRDRQKSLGLFTTLLGSCCRSVPGLAKQIALRFNYYK